MENNYSCRLYARIVTPNKISDPSLDSLLYKLRSWQSLEWVSSKLSEGRRGKVQQKSLLRLGLTANSLVRTQRLSKIGE